MAYATLQTLVDQVGVDEVTRSADRDLDGVADVAVVDRAIADADAEIDSYVGAIYKVPLAPVPSVVVTYSAVIAMYRLSSDIGTLTEEKRQRYEDAIRWLRDVASGKAVLGADVEPEAKSAGGIRFSAAPREFTTSRTRGIL
jgi:phage gp36-like protein